MICVYILNPKTMNFWEDHSLMSLFNSLKLSVFTCVWHLSFIVSSSMTLTSHAMVMYNSSGIFMFIFSVITLKTLHKLEIIGYLLFSLGYLWLLMDTTAAKAGNESHIVLGDLISTGGAVFGAIH
mmetsp:Transcript_43341/g.50931  ORF Transcript_43341/g.50931 Transcript_43341/m.50931 type:complete len:125 (-) Transcript_43341:555-929(-)